MATDITTLAIQLQSKEAESGLKTFNDLLTAGSKNAKGMEHMTIGVDVDEAVRQLSVFKASFDNIATAAQNIHFDLGMNMPTMLAPPPVEPADTAALEELKAFFQEAAEEMRKQSELVNESMEKLGAGAERTGTTVRVAGESMRGAGASAGEYAEKLRELNAAKKDLEKLAERADADGKAAYEADQRAREAKRDLLQAERELKKVSEQLNATHTGGAGDIMKLAEKEDALKTEVNNLSEAYKKARAEADKLNAKLDVSAGKADEARERFNHLKEEVAGIPAPTGKAGKSVDAFSVGAKKAGTAATKLARGFTSVARFGGLAVPGLAGLGRTIGMFSLTGPWVGAAVVGIAALAASIKKMRGESDKEAQRIKENAENALKASKAAKEFVSSGETDWKRLGDLSDMGSLTNTQNEEAAAIVRRLTERYGDLGIEIDKTTGKLAGYMSARLAANEKEREIQKETLEFSLKEAENYRRNQEKTFLESTKQGFTSGDSTAFKKSNEELANLVRDENTAEIDISKAFNSRKADLQAIISGEKELTYEIEHRDFQGNVTTTTGTVSKEAAAEQLKLLKAYEETWSAANKAKHALEDFNSEEAAQQNKRIEAAQKDLAKAQAGLVNEGGLLHLETEAEKYQRIEQEWYKIRDSIEEAQLAGKGEDEILKLKSQEANLAKEILTYQEKQTREEEKQAAAQAKANTAAAERLKKLQESYVIENGASVRAKTNDELSADRKKEIARLQKEIAEMTGTARRNATAADLAQWGKRYNPATGKMDGDQKQAGWRGILSDGKGGVMTEVSAGVTIDGKEVEIPLIIPESTQEDLKRIAQVANGELTDIPVDLMDKAMEFAKKRLAEGKSPFFNGDAADESLRNVDDILTLTEAQTRLLQLQAEQGKYAEAVQKAEKQNEAARKAYVIENGAVLRKKTEAELQREREKEIEAARARVAASKEGTMEHAQAQAELDRLAIEEYNARKKTNASAVLNDAKEADTRLMRGIEARSSEALALESRTFTKDDSEKALMKDTKEIQTDIKDIVQKMLNAIEASFSNLNDKLQSV